MVEADVFYVANEVLIVAMEALGVRTVLTHLFLQESVVFLWIDGRAVEALAARTVTAFTSSGFRRQVRGLVVSAANLRLFLVCSFDAEAVKALSARRMVALGVELLLPHGFHAYT